MIKVVGLQKSYKNGEYSTKILKGIDLEIKDGDFVVILGASGSGKTTLMNCISGLEKFDSGSIMYNNQEISNLSEGELTKFRKDNVGFIFQQYYLLPNLSVYQNVKMGANLASNAVFSDIIEAVGLKDKMDKLPSSLSGGEQQRVSIARALAKKPKVLFMDEPTGALDEETGRLVLDYICKLQKEMKFTMIMVTHNNNIADMANTIIKLNSGRIVSINHNEKQKTAYEIGW